MTDIRPATGADRATILSIAEGSGLFDAGDLAFFADDFDGWGAGDPRLWLLSGDAAAAQAAPEAMSDNVWNMLFIATDPAARRRGHALALLRAVEGAVRARDARMLLIDTASIPEMAAARALYSGAGYDAVATIPDYYGDGVDRVTYRRAF